jgi:DNA ligase (NAD+)
MISNSLIDSLNADPILFILDNDAPTIISIIKYANDQYHNNQSIISDEIFDMLIDLIKDIDPTNKILKQIGATIHQSQRKVKLPFTMFSMDKIKPTDINIINRWKVKNVGPYICSDKLDGVSGLLFNKNKKLSLFTRGDGYEGSDITHLIKYIPSIANINVDILPDNIAIRGELIISKKKFMKYSTKFANGRNMVSGIVNSKKLNKDIIFDIDFVSYELINPWIQNQNEQFIMLNNFGLNVVYHKLNIDIDFDNLSMILVERKLDSNYEVDGIIISNNLLPNRTTDSNPDYAFAFKDMSLADSADVEVIEVEWNISKDGYIKPKLKIQPTKLSGVVISNVTAYNAKFVVDNILGPGAIIRLIRSGDVIPKIISTIKVASDNKPQLPNLSYIWTDSMVDIIINDENTIEQKIKELTFFVKKLNIENIDEAIISKLIDADIDTIEKIMSIDKSDLSNISGFKEKMIEKIYMNIHTRMKNLTILDIMIASNTFGHGLGERKLTKIMETYPDIIKLYSDNDNDTIIDLIKEIDGFDTKTAEYFVKGLDKFIDLFNKLKPDMRKQLRQSILLFEEELDNKQLINNKFTNKIFVFSGFRNKEWESIIESNNGKVGTSISSKTSILITNEVDNTSSKVIKAKSLNIQILTKEQFETQFIL